MFKYFLVCLHHKDTAVCLCRRLLLLTWSFECFENNFLKNVFFSETLKQLHFHLIPEVLNKRFKMFLLYLIP